MKTIASRIWNEPAVAIGFLVSAGLLVAGLISNVAWDVGVIVGMTAPLATSLGIRQVVVPNTNHTNRPDTTDAP